MKALVDFLGFLLVIALITILIFGMEYHTIDESHIKVDFKVKELVYVLPDSTEAMIEDGFVITAKEKNEITKKREVVNIVESYNVIYTDKNGVINRLKQVSPELLIKRIN